MSYVSNDFLLTTKTANALYEKYAKNTPIFDYHCHLSEKQILENKPFNDLYEIWLSGDHYKWRLMRNYGIEESYITGDKSNKEKFIAYTKALSTAFGNPLYHWSQVELKEFFNCELEINEANAPLIWDWCNEYIRLNKITPQTLIEKSNVKILFTTNEAFDDLTVFEKLAEKDYKFTVLPAFRADKIMNIEAEGYKDFVSMLENLTLPICDLESLEQAIKIRVNDFIKVGATASDISVERVYPVTDKSLADKIFKLRLKGDSITDEQAQVFKGYLTYSLMKIYAQAGLKVELHVGAMRNNSTVMLKKLGLDTGFDSISDENSIKTLSRLFDRLQTENSLPATIVFNLNPKMNLEIMTLIGCFQDHSESGKMQYGPAWWFLDNKAGMEKHLLDLTSTGHIATFVGMLTDSRSFLSYPRHHYFRRILCSFFGKMMENGEMTKDEELVGQVVENVSFNNAIKYFGVEKWIK